MEQGLANSLFSVYLSLQAIHKDKAFLQKRSVITQQKSAVSSFTLSFKNLKTIQPLHLITVQANLNK